MTHLELKQIRIDNGLKQSDIANLLGIKQSYVSDMESGKKPISKQTEEILFSKYGRPSTDEKPEEIIPSNLDLALKIIKAQSDSLAAKDDQISRLITLLEKQLN